MSGEEKEVKIAHHFYIKLLLYLLHVPSALQSITLLYLLLIACRHFLASFDQTTKAFF